MYYEDIAKVCHEANRALQECQHELHVSPSWEDVSDDIRESAIEGVISVVHSRNAKPYQPYQLHKAWMDNRIANGWIYGPVRDDEKKEHPNLTHWSNLPRSQQLKDSLFISIVRTLA